jgi:hypothetical protein
MRKGGLLHTSTAAVSTRSTLSNDRFSHRRDTARSEAPNNRKELPYWIHPSHALDSMLQFLARLMRSTIRLDDCRLLLRSLHTVRARDRSHRSLHFAHTFPTPFRHMFQHTSDTFPE